MGTRRDHPPERLQGRLLAWIALVFCAALVLSGVAAGIWLSERYEGDADDAAGTPDDGPPGEGR